MNNAPMTKQPPSASALRPSRLCQCLAVALVLKIALVGGIAYESFGSPAGTTPSTAFAADTPQNSLGAAPQPATIDSPLSGAGMTAPTPPLDGLGPDTPPPSNNSSSLPSIGTKTGIGTASGPRGAQVNATQVASDTLARDALVRRQEELARKEEELKNLEKEISGKLEQMQVLESRLQIMMKDAKGSTDAKLRHLVDVLSNMKAKQAAQVLETLDMRIGVQVLSNMRGRQAGEILTFVAPEKAAALAEALSRMQMPLE